MHKVGADSPFFAAALREVPRLLGQVDRNPLSRTYGSCDRAFWLYRTNDINSMRYQEAALTLALLWKTPFEGNIYYRDERMLAWSNAVIRFACERQHKDGSWDEWYVNEGSFVCTAFVSHALAQAALILSESLTERERLVEALCKSGTWLSSRSEELVVNQLSGAIAALHAIHLVTGEKKFKRFAQEKCETFLSLQNSEGWWSEYGGPDIGYLSLTVDYLSRYAEGKDDARIRGAIERACAFLLRFVHPDGTAGGEYMARNTEYLVPSGFLRAAGYSFSAREVASLVEKNLEEEKGIAPRSLDDRYLCYILYNWLEAGMMGGAAPAADVREKEAFFPAAGLFSGGGEGYRLYANVKKGGSLRLYAPMGVLVDGGLNVRQGSAVYTSNMLHPQARGTYDERSHELVSRGVLIRVRAPLLTTPRAIILKSAQWLIGGLPAFQRLLKKVLRAAAVTKPGAESVLRYERIVRLEPRGVRITDTVTAPLPRDALVVGVPSVYALVPSSRYAPLSLPKLLRPSREEYESSGGVTRLIREFSL